MNAWLSCMLQAVRLVSVTCVAPRPCSQALTLIHTLFTHSLLVFSAHIHFSFPFYHIHSQTQSQSRRNEIQTAYESYGSPVIQWRDCSDDYQQRSPNALESLAVRVDAANQRVVLARLRVNNWRGLSGEPNYIARLDAHGHCRVEKF